MGLKDRRQREIEERRRQILDAARNVLLHHGMRQASIKKMARAAELGVGTIYFYFRNKEDVFIALQEEGLSILSRSIQTAASRQGDVQQKLRRIAEAYLAFSVKEKYYFDILNHFLSEPDIVFDTALKRQIDEHGARILAHVIQVIDQGVQTGAFREVNGRQAAVMLWGLLHGMLHLKKMENTILMGENFKGLYRAAVETFIQGLKPVGRWPRGAVSP